MKPVAATQYGGTAIFSIGSAAHRVAEKGSDPSKLGRWTWTRYRGKNNQTLRVITAYRPNQPNGPFTVYAQHNAFFHSSGSPRCPRKAFLQDLCEDLHKFLECGDNIILMLDGNSNMRQSDLKSALELCTLKEAILDKHGLQGPETFRRNNTKTPIDGIWVSPNIDIKACGYFDYDDVFANTDHRCLWIDISYVTAFGHIMPVISRPSSRRLHCKDPRLVSNYVRRFKDYILKHNMLSKLQCLKDNSSHPMTEYGKQLYEEMDSLRCKGVAFAERKCRKLRKGQVAYSPQLDKISRQIDAWTLMEKKKKGLKVSSRRLQRSLIKASIPSNVRALTLEDISLKLKGCFQEYYKIKGSSKEIRNSAMETLAEALAEQGNTKKEKIIQVIRHREKQRDTARKIKYLRKKINTGSTTRVTIHTLEGEVRELTEKGEIEDAIMANNQAKYQQSFHTPFLTPPLRDEFGFKGLTTAAQAVLGGVYETHHQIDEYTKAFLDELQIPIEVRSLGQQTMQISLEKYRNFWKKADERTSCYPGDLSFATMKAGATDDIIAELECGLVNIALTSGYSPERWRNLLDVMILKKSGITELSSLRTICLFPVDCNYAFKHIGREMMKVAEATNSLACEQYGSRRSHRSIDLAVNKALTYDLLRQLRRPGAICSNDAKSCYDLIGHSQASMAMQRNGVPREAVNCLFTTLQDASHRVRTGYGDSTSSYGGHRWITPMHGIGQGNGAGPAIWAVLSSPLLNMLRSGGFGCEFMSPFSKELTQFVGYAFVDDTDIIVSKPSMNSFTEVASSLQHAVDMWEGGLKATCGAIVPEKTFWYLIDFSWAAGRWSYKSLDDCPGSIFINDLNGMKKELRRFEVQEAQETLGVYLAPDGNTLKQYEKMKEMAIKWADCIRTGRISKDDAWLAFYSTLWKSLSYPLPALNLSKDDCEKIMAPVLTYLLPAMGVCRNFSRVLVYSSVKYMGLGIKHPHTIQELLRIKDIVNHTQYRSTTGQLYRSSFEVFFLEIGMGTDIHNIPEEAIKLLSTDTLVKSTCLFLKVHSLELRHDIILKPLRDNDKPLMTAFLHLQPNSDELTALNRCRLYLQVYWLSEICTGDGIAITEDACRGQWFEVPHKMRHWPRQHKPTKNDWNIWKSFLKKAFTYRGLRLRIPLGDWLHMDSDWEWYFSPSQECLFKHTDGAWLSFSQIHKRDRLPTFSIIGSTSTQPKDLHRASIYTNHNRIVCTGHAPILSKGSFKRDSFLQHVATSEPSQRWCFNHIELSDDGRIVAEAIKQGDAIAISDGSFKEQYGTASWVLEGLSSTGRIIGVVTAPGTAKDQSAYRSELVGIYSIMICVKNLCEFFDISNGSIELGCDGQSALDKAFNYVALIKVDDSNYDILSALRTLWAHSPIQWKFRHIKGHQDDDRSMDSLDRWAKLNIEMDKRAKDHMNIAKQLPRHYTLTGEPWSIWFQGKKIVTDWSDTMYDIVHSEAAKEYWMRKDNLPQGVVESINWDLIEIAMSESKRSKRVFISKHTSGMCGVGKFMKRWKMWQDDACPRCGEPEDAAHVWTCHGEGVDDMWDKALSDLEGWFNQKHTDPDLQHTILLYLRNWRKEEEEPTLTPFFLEEIVQGQSNIGWQRFFEGWIHREWTIAQQAYYQVIKSRRSGKRWTVELIKKLWAIAWDLWEHRNGILHETQNVVSNNELRALNRRVIDTYTNLQSILLPAHDRHLLLVKLPRLLKKDKVYKEVWLRNSLVVLDSRRNHMKEKNRSQRLLSGMRRCMKRFLRKTPVPLH